MTIGASLFLIVVGAILKFATDFQVAQIDIDTVGVILMIAGGVGLVLGLVMEGIRRRDRREEIAAADRREVRVEERRDPPPPGY